MYRVSAIFFTYYSFCIVIYPLTINNNTYKTLFHFITKGLAIKSLHHGDLIDWIFFLLFSLVSLYNILESRYIQGEL